MKHVLCLFDKSGIIGKPWAENGFRVTCVDWGSEPRFEDNIRYECIDLKDRDFVFNRFDKDKPDIIFSFPECTDLAVSGAAHFASKREKDPEFQFKAIELFKTGEILAKRYNCPSLTENPVSVAATMYRRPTAYYHPYEYGGYLPEDDIHPIWPRYIAPRDAYPKKTGAWCYNGFTLPQKRCVPIKPGYSDQHTKLGGKSAKTKEIRSMTPRGLAMACYEHLKDKL